MNIINIHRRIITQPISALSPMLDSMASLNDMFWPYEKWPRIKFKDGLQIGNSGHHGPIHYDIVQFDPGVSIRFKFTRPKGFDGFHQLDLIDLKNQTTEVKHTIDMVASGSAIIKWTLGIRWLHDALVEDALDKIQNHLSSQKKSTKWNLWVRFLRSALG